MAEEILESQGSAEIPQEEQSQIEQPQEQVQIEDQEQQQQLPEPPKKMSVKDFASKIKAKYPAYANIEDNQLVSKMLEKYPVYKDKVEFGQPTQELPAQPPKPKPDWQTNFEKTINSGLFNTRAEAVSTRVAKPITPEAIAQVQKSKAEKNIAIDGTVERRLKNKGIVAAKNSPTYQAERKKVVQALDDGDAVLSKDQITGEPVLAKTIGFWQSMVDGTKEAIDHGDNADVFVNSMNTEQRVEAANRMISQRKVSPEGYVGEVPQAKSFFWIPVSPEVGSVLAGGSKTVGGVAPFMAKATAGTMAGAALVAAAPETGGATLAAIPAVMGFAFTLPDAVNQGGMDEVVRSYQLIKQRNKNISDVDAMKEAEKGLLRGEVAGGLMNMAFMGAGGSPLADIGEKAISNEAKTTISKYVGNAVKSGVKMGGIVSATETGKEAVAGVQDKKLRLSAGELANNAVTSFVENAKVGTLLHTLATVPELPGAIKSSFKFALSKENPAELTQVLQVNEALGNVPEGTTEKVITDQLQFNEALGKTSEGLTPEAQASVAGLIQKRDKLTAEMASKDPTQVEAYKQQIDALNEQIKKITESNDPLEHEVNVIGEKLSDAEKKVTPELPKERVYRIEYTDNETGKVLYKHFPSEAEGNKWFAENKPGEFIFGTYEGGEELPKQEKITQYDTENITGIPSKVGVGEKPIEAQPIEGGGAQEISGGRDIQKEGEGAKEAQVEPIRQLGTGANVYFESNKYRVNDDLKSGKILLNVGDANSEMPLANIEFDSPNEAVFVAKKLQENSPQGLTEGYHNINKIIENFKKEYIELSKTEKEAQVSGEVPKELSSVEETAKALEDKDIYDLSKNIHKDIKETLQERIDNQVYKIPNKVSRWGIKDRQYTYSSKKEASKVVEDGYKRDLYSIELNRKRETNKSISEAYHKAKADGSNPELVKAVEDLIGKKYEGEPIRKEAGGAVQAMPELPEEQKVKEGLQPSTTGISKGTTETTAPVLEGGEEAIKETAKALKNASNTGKEYLDFSVYNPIYRALADIEYRQERKQEAIERAKKEISNIRKGIYDKNIGSYKEQLEKANKHLNNMENTPITDDKFYNVQTNDEIAEAYHKAKADGSNPELVKAVEDLIGGEEVALEPQEKALSKELNITEDEARKAKSAKPKRARKSKDIAETLESEAKIAEISGDAERANEIIESIDSATESILSDKETKDSFEQKHGVSETAILKEMADMGKNGDFPTAYKNLTGKEATTESQIDFLSAASSEGIKVRPKLKIEFEEGKNVVETEPLPRKKSKKTGVDSLQNVVGKDPLRPAFEGVYFDNENIIATDAHKLVILPKTESDADIINKIIEANYKNTKKKVPSYTMEQATKYINEKLKGGLNGKIVNFKEGDIVEERYPDYKAVLPTYENSVKVDVQKLIDIANGANSIKDNLSNGLFNIALKLNGEEVGFNPKVLLDAIVSLQENGAKEIELFQNGDPKKALLIKADNGSTALVMPILLGESVGKSQLIDLAAKKELPKETKAEPKVELPKEEIKPEPIKEEKPIAEQPKPKGKKVGKYESMMIEAGKSIDEIELPGFLKIKDTEIKKAGVGEQELKDLLKESLRIMGKLMDKGVEVSEAVKIAVKNLVKAQGEEYREQIEKGFEKYYNEKVGEEMKAEEPPKGELPKFKETKEDELRGIRMADNAERRSQIGMEERKPNPESVEQWRAKAQEEISKGYNIDKLIGKMEKGEMLSPVENEISRIFASTLDNEVIKNPTNENINAYERFIKARELASSKIGQSLRSLQGVSNPLENISDFFVAAKESFKVDELTESQIAEVKRDFENIKLAKEEYRKKLENAEAKLAEVKAQNELLKQQKQKQAGEKKIYTPDGKRDFKAERENLKQKLKDVVQKYKDNANKLGLASDGGAEGFAISVDMAKIISQIARNHVEEVGTKLAEVTKRTLEDVKDIFDGITEKDIKDVIAGKYSEKKETKSELVANWNQIKSEAKLLNELDRVLAGEPKTEQQRIERNQELASLRRQINEVKKKGGLDEYSEEAKIKRAIEANKRKEKELQERLANGDFESQEKRQSVYESKDFKQKYPELYKELLDSKIKAEKAELEFNRKLIENEMKNMSKVDKFKQILLKSRGTLKAFFAGIDDSAVGVQNWFQSIRNPVIGVKALRNHVIDFWSNKRFERRLAELHESADYYIMRDSGLSIYEPESLLEKAKDEFFPTRFKAIIKLNGKEYGWLKIGDKKYELFDVLKPFERAFTSLGNSLRVIKFRTEAEKMYEKGLTFEKNPEEFKKLATRINAMTSASEPSKAFKGDLVNLAIWSPRLMASKLNILGISDLASFTSLVEKGYYRSLGEKGKILSKQQLYAAADLAKFATSIVAGSYLYAAARGGKLNTNPYDDDFMDIELPNGKSYNFSGGFSKYIATLFQIMSGGEVSRLTGKYQKYSGFKDRGAEILHFMRGKMPPVSGSIVNLLDGEDYTGKETSLSAEAGRFKAPMAISQISKQIDKDGYSSLFMDGIPTFMGISVKDDRDYSKPKALFEKEEFNSPEMKFLLEKDIIPGIRKKEQYKIKKDVKHPDGLMSDSEFDIFVELAKKYMKEGFDDEKSIKDILETDYLVQKVVNGDVVKEDYIKGKNLDKEKLSNKINSLKQKAIDKAKFEMGFEEEKTIVKEQE